MGGHRPAGATVWFTGLPASGKSTIAAAVDALVESGQVAYLLDGDNLRHGLSDDLGFSGGDRAENIRRVGHLTRLLADAGVVALASLVSPLRSDGEIARILNDAAKLMFIEVYVPPATGEPGPAAGHHPRRHRPACRASDRSAEPGALDLAVVSVSHATRRALAGRAIAELARTP